LLPWLPPLLPLMHIIDVLKVMIELHQHSTS
jgi:hypothetical protein